MALTMHSASVPVFVRMLGNLVGWLDKAESHARDKKFEPSVYLGARLAPDMLPLPTQIQIACDAAKFCVARLAGVEAPPFPDDAREISVPRRAGSITMTGEAYLKTFALPNFFFHVTTTYALLRHNGVELGKADFLGALPQAAAA
jgi:hypothetical protein